MSDNLLLVGASVRAAAQSALRGGFAPWCADLFADRDLRAIAPVRRVGRYPAGIVAALDTAPAAPFLYTGALENYPALIDALSHRHPLWGNGGEVLRAVRDPLALAAALRDAGVNALEVARCPTDLPRDGTWLCKPLRSGGGWRIHPWDEASLDPTPSGFCEARPSRSARQAGGCYFQRRIGGFDVSALYVAAGGAARLLGITQQWVGASWTGARPFQYAGSIGPLPLTPQVQGELQEIGSCLAGTFQLTGLFGVDAVINDAGVWTVEVNPRYPASAEVLERAGDFSAIRLHATACVEGLLPSAPQARGAAGKAVVFAGRPGRMPQSLVDWAEQQNAGAPWPRVADLPDAGTPLRPGSPVMTVLAAGDELAEVEAQLRSQVAAIKRFLASHSALP